MFPLEFPKRVLGRANPKEVVADPYCGRGTTVYAARMLGLRGFGVDTSPVAVAISRAKLVSTTVSAVMQTYDRLMESVARANCPTGEFWDLAYHPDTLKTLCRLRSALIASASTRGANEPGSVAMLRAITLGALHGPLRANRVQGIYFSNQMMRTFSSKPGYAVRFWENNGLVPQPTDVRGIIRERASRIVRDTDVPDAIGQVIAGDSRETSTWESLSGRIRWVVTSPPYYGMHTYEEDQWLRVWFLGGLDHVRYRNPNQLSHSNQEVFANSMAKVWDCIGDKAHPDLLMAVRFGAIQSRKSNYRQIMRDSLKASRHPWRLVSGRAAGAADYGRRQALSMGERAKSTSIEEHDFYVMLS